LAEPVEPESEPVADHERLARYCDPKVAKTGKVNFGVFAASKEPFDISVDRTSKCDPYAKATSQNRWFVTVDAGSVRKISGANVSSTPPPPEHASIGLVVTSAAGALFPTKLSLQAEATAWKEYSMLIEALRPIAVVAPPKR
jgi:hypothetical protein